MRPPGRPNSRLLRQSVLVLVISLFAATSVPAAAVDRVRGAGFANATPATSFVTRAGSSLTVDGRPFRFAGANAYWLQLDDNVRDGFGAPTYPTAFRIDDAMRTAQAMGVTVVRTWANSVGCGRCLMPERGRMNPEAFASLDYAVASARRHGQRLVLTLVDNWDYYHGGKLTYTRWRGVPEWDFFWNPQVLADYTAFGTAVVTHVNPHTGLAYRDDPTILGWETGNELWCQTCGGNYWDRTWTQSVARHLHAVAPRQLVIDGHGTDPSCTQACLHEDSLDIPEVDIVDDHHYPPNIARVRSASATAAAHGRAYVVGEYDWRNTGGGDPLASFLGAVEQTPTAGAFMWSIVPHADTSGFVDHADGFEYFFPGRTLDERARTSHLIAHAVRMRGAAITAAEDLPAAVGNVSAVRTGQGIALTWRGAAGTDRYVVQRRAGGERQFTTVTSTVWDTSVTSVPLYVDRSARALGGDRLDYRVVSVGRSGRWGGTATVSAR